jgi:hypothetical protein
MPKIKKKEIRQTVDEAMGGALEKLKISTPSRKTKKVLAKVSRKFTKRLKKEVNQIKVNKVAKTPKIKASEKNGVPVNQIVAS